MPAACVFILQRFHLSQSEEKLREVGTAPFSETKQSNKVEYGQHPTSMLWQYLGVKTTLYLHIGLIFEL